MPKSNKKTKSTFDKSVGYALVQWMIADDQDEPTYFFFKDTDGYTLEKYKLMDFRKTPFVQESNHYMDDDLLYKDTTRLAKYIRHTLEDLCSGYTDLSVKVKKGIIYKKYKVTIESDVEEENESVTNPEEKPCNQEDSVM